MFKKKEINTTGAANKETKGVHVNHSYDQFEKTTYSTSSWTVNMYDPSELVASCWMTMQRRVSDGGNSANYILSTLTHETKKGTQLDEIQFNADDTSILAKKARQYGYQTPKKLKKKIKKEVHYYYKGREYGCPLTDAQLKTICDADVANMRVISLDGHVDISDKQSKVTVEFLKCFYRECIDNEAYPEVADKLPVKAKKKMKILWWHWLVGILLLGLIANLAGF